MKHLCFVVKNILIHPSRAFRSIIEEKRVGECAWVVLIYFLVSGAPRMMNTSVWENLVNAFMTLAMVLLFSAFLHGTAWLFNAKGEFKALLIAEGYCCVTDILFFPIFYFWVFGFQFFGLIQGRQVHIASWYEIILEAIIFSYIIWKTVLEIIVIQACYRVSVKKAIGISVVSLIVSVVIAFLLVAFLNIGGAVVGAFGA